MVRLRGKTALVVVGVLAAFLTPQAAAAILKCFCSDCPVSANQICYGEICTMETFDLGESSVRWRCLNDSLHLCNLSSSVLSYKCCDGHDFCNNKNFAPLAGDEKNRTSDSECVANSSATAEESTRRDNSTVNCTETTNGTDDGSTSTGTISITPLVPDSSIPTRPPPADLTPWFDCYEAESTNPHTFNFTFCETTKSCYNSLR
jgi:hypothetical protein